MSSWRAAQIWRTVSRPFFAIDSRHHRTASVHVRRHRLVHNLIRMQCGLSHAGNKLGLVHQSTVVIDLDQAGIEQRFQRFRVLMLFGKIPGILRGRDLGLLGIWLCCRLCG